MIPKEITLLWLCGIPLEVQNIALGGQDVGAHASWSWVMGHLPPPANVALHIACPAKNISEPLEFDYRGATFHLFPYPRGSAYTFFKNWFPGFRCIHQQVQPDWVFGWGTEAGFSSNALALDSKRSIVEIQGHLSSYFSHMKKTLPLVFGVLNEKLVLRKATRLLAESNYSAQETKKYTKGRVGIVYHPLRDEFLEVEVGDKKKKQIIFLGNLAPGKGIKDAVQAFAGASSNDWTLLCVGRGETDYLQEINELTKKLRVENRVQLCGVMSPDEIVALYEDSPVFLLPSYQDTGPTALKEALAMGLWPVCYDNSGPQELIGRYQYGSLAPTGDILALTESLRISLEEQPWGYDRRMGNCVKRIRHDLARNTVWSHLLICCSEDYWRNSASLGIDALNGIISEDGKS